VKPLFAAIQFLTIAPVPASWAGGTERLVRSIPYFPIVGLLIGGFLVAFDWALRIALPGPLISATLVVLAMEAVSGALHLDGLADSADGLLSARTRDRALEIMRDSRAGPMGVAAVTGILLAKVAALAELPCDARWRILVLMPLAGRAALVLKLALLPYARPEGGLATLFKTSTRPWHAVWALSVLTAGGALVLGWAGIAGAAAAFAATALFARYCLRRIGGLTGDTLGAACELAELAAALGVLAYIAAGA